MKKVTKYGWVLLFFLAACLTGSLDFNIQYNTISGLKKGDRVVHDANSIGQVEKVIYTDNGDYRVAVSIEKDHAHLATETSLFFISADPEKDGQSVIEVFHNKDGNPIQSGQTIAGATPTEAALQILHDKFEKQINEFAEGLKQVWDKVLTGPDEQQLEALEKQIDQILQELETLSTAAKKKLETDILPEIHKQLEKMRELFQGEKYTDQLDSIDNKLKKISNGV